MLQLSRSAARALHLAALDLLTPPSAPAAPEDVMTAIRRMGVLQIDTISVVARSPYLVLWSRLGSYDPRWLEDALVQGHLFEYWAHAACFIPIEDYPYFRRMMVDRLRGWWNVDRWLEEHRGTAEAVLERIRREGPLRSADFEAANRPEGGWWNWKEEKLALEQLHTAGELMIARRQGFQRVYDLRERVLPDWRDKYTPSWDEVLRALVLKSVQALGVARSRWVADYYRLKKNGLQTLLETAAQDGQLLPVAVEGWDDICWVHPSHAERLHQAAAGQLVPTHTTLLSPFDPLVWDRSRAQEFFGFDYTIECYLPAPQRRYGYFSLPILDCGELIGRLDAKLHRKERIFEIRSFFLEEGVQMEEARAARLARSLRSCATWCSADRVQPCEQVPAVLAAALSVENFDNLSGF